MSDSVQPHRQQGLLCPWDSPGKSTGVGYHFLLQCMKLKSESEVAQSCSTFSDPMDWSLPGSSIHGIFQARVLEWGAIAFSDSKLRRFQFFIVFALPKLCPRGMLSLLCCSQPVDQPFATEGNTVSFHVVHTSTNSPEQKAVFNKSV